MLEKAKDKLKSEMEKSANNQYIQVIGQFLIQYLDKDPGTAEKIMVADKTIIKSLDAMKEAARKKATGGWSMLTEQEGFNIVLKYYGIQGEAAGITSIAAQTVPANPKHLDADFDIKLEDLL